MNWYLIALGACMLLGSLATINSAASTKFDHDLSLFLMLGAIVTLLLGTNLIDTGTIRDLMP